MSKEHISSHPDPRFETSSVTNAEIFNIGFWKYENDLMPGFKKKPTDAQPYTYLPAIGAKSQRSEAVRTSRYDATRHLLLEHLGKSGSSHV